MDRVQVQVYDQDGEFMGLRDVAALPAIGQLIIVYDEWFQVVQVWHHAVPCIQVDRPHVALPPMPKFLTSHAALKKILKSQGSESANG